jgi:hypothetical protein
VAIHVLSDYLVITQSKKNIISGKYKTVIDKVCPISDIGCIDMKDSNGEYLLIRNVVCFQDYQRYRDFDVQVE